jgi:hypothetical protein
VVGLGESVRDKGVGREQAHGAAVHPVGVVAEPPALAGTEFVAALNVEQDPDAEEPSAEQSAGRPEAAGAQLALVQ